MGLPSIGDVVNQVSNVLGSGPPAPGSAGSTPMAHVDATYQDMGNLTDVQGNKPGATALNHANLYDLKVPIRFVHFGRIHTDAYDSYFHSSGIQDDQRGVLPDGNTGIHGVMFRAALEREAIVINAYIACAASVAQDLSASDSSKNSGAAGMLNGIADNNGPLGGMNAVQNLGGAVGGLLGGNSGTSSSADPSALKPYQSAVQSAGAKVNVTSLPYVDMHQAGLDLHQDWLNFDKFASTMPAPKSNAAGSGLLGNIPGTLSGLGVPSLGGASDIIGTVTSILFSMYEIYQGMYQNVRKTLEPVVRDQCYARSIAAIKSSQQPIFDVWSVSPDQSTPPPKPNHKEQIVTVSTGTAADKVLNPVNDTYDQGLNDVDSARNAVTDAGNSWDSFWNSPPQKAGPGQDQLNAILAAFADPTSQIFAAFASTVKKASSSINEAGFPLSIVNKVLGIIVPACCGMLGNIVIQLQDPAFIKGGITRDAFDAAGRVYIRTKLASLLVGTGILDSILGPVNSALSGAQDMAGNGLSGAKSAIGNALGGVPGVNQYLQEASLPGSKKQPFSPLSSQGVTNKALGLADSLAGKDLDPIMDFAMDSIHHEFVKTISQVDQNSMVMEVFLGQLPLMIPLLVRNIFFPFWQMLVDKALGPLGSVANLASSPVASLMSSARDTTNDAKKDVQKLKNNLLGAADDAAKYGLNLQGDNDQQRKQFADSVFGTDDELNPGGNNQNTSPSGGGFPGSARKTSCSTASVTKADYDHVDKIDSPPQARIQ